VGQATLLDEVVERVRRHPGLHGKAPIGLVAEALGPTDWRSGPGDDGAVVPDGPEGSGEPQGGAPVGREGSGEPQGGAPVGREESGEPQGGAPVSRDGSGEPRGGAPVGRGGSLVVGGEAMLPRFVEADPFGAGVSAVLTNANDLAAMGAWPLAIVDTVVGPEALARRVLEGLRHGSELYRVPVVGGHLTVRDGPPAVSAFGLGRAEAVLSVRAAAPGQTLLVTTCLDGTMRPDFPFFSSIAARGGQVADDVRLLPEVAATGACVAAKDVSMAGLLGSLAMLLEYGRLGATVDLDAVPRPAGVPLPAWVVAFPAFSFLLCAPPGRVEDCRRPFLERGLACEPVAVLDGSGELRVRLGEAEALALDLNRERVTGLPDRSG
jgi:selenophosphate synthetase-related protein